MSKTFEMTGIIHSMGATTTYGNNGFTKREFVLKATGADENSSYPNYVAFELIKEKCSLLDQYNVGEELQVSFNISGRLWQAQDKPERCFTSLQVWRINRADQNQPGAQMQQSQPNYDQSYQSNNPVPSQQMAAAANKSAPQPSSTSFSNDDWDDDIPF
ncbi:DUF3127 domain-containing protein [Shewanella intestini]|uniref:DUF3127 domain-containing protein n=1 Tax=Shewanella intestini TaxID=2017544 RepID=A0ABS5I1N5_9GAMM|nr:MULTISPECIES: DUF3127 domain-containing protein [Shewanella]MBR9727932.1 DUF3127 domain-containing protein [Shewanella intestini]MRG36517.1 DUF3127 domain-containing protein [Shewanella sp. XMDDZSB0408]